MKVLIVDGSRDSRRDTVDALSQLTNVVILGAVANVRTALHALADAPPDVVITETALPDGDGAQLAARIRRLERSPSIVAVASAANDEERDRYLAAGVDRYVSRDSELRSIQEAVVSLGRGRSTIPPTDSQRLLGKIAGGVAHDANNYLVIVEGLLSLAQRHPDDESLWERLRVALDALRDLNAMVLAHARGIAPDPVVLDLGELVQHVIAVCRPIIPHNVELQLSIAEGLRPIKAVRPELQQLVLNLVVNACEAMPDGGVLHAAVTRTGSAAVHLRMADSGIGMNSERPRRDGGRGLGLGIVRAVVDHHGGAMQVATRPGGGTIVDVMLPT